MAFCCVLRNVVVCFGEAREDARIVADEAVVELPRDWHAVTHEPANPAGIVYQLESIELIEDMLGGSARTGAIRY